MADSMIRRTALLNVVIMGHYGGVPGLNRLERDVDQATLTAAGRAKRNLAVLSSAAMVPGLAAVGLVYEATKAYNNFASVTQHVRGQTNITTTQLAQLRTATLGYLRQYGQGINDTSDAYRRAYNTQNDFFYKGMAASQRAAKQAKDAHAVVTEAVKASFGTGDPASSIANTIGAALYSYNLEASKMVGHLSEAQIVLAEMHTGAADTNMKLGEFAQNLSNVLPVAHQLGISLAEVGGMYASLTKGGFTGPQAQTQIRGLLQQIQRPTPLAETHLQAISNQTGIDLVRAFSASGVQQLGLPTVFAELREAMAREQRLGLNPTDVLSSIITQRRGLTGIFNLLSNQGMRTQNQVAFEMEQSGQGRYRNAQGQWVDAGYGVGPNGQGFHRTVNDVMADAYRRSLPGQLQVLRGSEQSLFIDLGKTISGPLTQAVHGLIPLVQGLDKWLGQAGNQQKVVSMLKLAGVIGGVGAALRLGIGAFEVFNKLAGASPWLVLFTAGVIAYEKWKPFHDLVNGIATGLWNVSKAVAGFTQSHSTITKIALYIGGAVIVTAAFVKILRSIAGTFLSIGRAANEVRKNPFGYAKDAAQWMFGLKKAVQEEGQESEVAAAKNKKLANAKSELATSTKAAAAQLRHLGVVAQAEGDIANDPVHQRMTANKQRLATLLNQNIPPGARYNRQRQERDAEIEQLRQSLAQDFETLNQAQPVRQPRTGVANAARSVKLTGISEVRDTLGSIKVILESINTNLADFLKIGKVPEGTPPATGTTSRNKKGGKQEPVVNAQTAMEVAGPPPVMEAIGPPPPALSEDEQRRVEQAYGYTDRPEIWGEGLNPKETLAAQRRKMLYIATYPREKRKGGPDVTQYQTFTPFAKGRVRAIYKELQQPGLSAARRKRLGEDFEMAFLAGIGTPGATGLDLFAEHVARPESHKGRLVGPEEAFGHLIPREIMDQAGFSEHPLNKSGGPSNWGAPMRRWLSRGLAWPSSIVMQYKNRNEAAKESGDTPYESIGVYPGQGGAVEGVNQRMLRQYRELVGDKKTGIPAAYTPQQFEAIFGKTRPEMKDFFPHVEENKELQRVFEKAQIKLLDDLQFETKTEEKTIEEIRKLNAGRFGVFASMRTNPNAKTMYDRVNDVTSAIVKNIELSEAAEKRVVDSLKKTDITKRTAMYLGLEENDPRAKEVSANIMRMRESPQSFREYTQTMEGINYHTKQAMGEINWSDFSVFERKGAYGARKAGEAIKEAILAGLKDLPEDLRILGEEAISRRAGLLYGVEPGSPTMSGVDFKKIAMKIGQQLSAGLRSMIPELKLTGEQAGTAVESGIVQSTKGTSRLGRLFGRITPVTVTGHGPSSEHIPPSEQLPSGEYLPQGEAVHGGRLMRLGGHIARVGGTVGMAAMVAPLLLQQFDPKGTSGISKLYNHIMSNKYVSTAANVMGAYQMLSMFGMGGGGGHPILRRMPGIGRFFRPPVGLAGTAGEIGAEGAGIGAEAAGLGAEVTGGGGLASLMGGEALIPGVGWAALGLTAAGVGGYEAFTHRKQIGQFLGRAGTAIGKSGFGHALGGIGNAIGHALGGAKKEMENFGGFLSHNWKTIGLAILSPYTLLFTTDLGLKIRNWLGHAKDQMIHTITGWGSSLKGAISQAFGGFFGFFGGLPGRLQGYAHRMIDGFKNGIGHKANDLKRAAGNAFSSVKHFFGFGSPNPNGDDPEKWAKNMMSGFNNGINKMTGDIKKLIQSITILMKDFMAFDQNGQNKKGDDFNKSSTNMLSAFIQGIKNLQVSMETESSNTLDLIKKFLTFDSSGRNKNNDDYNKSGQNIATGLMTGMSSKKQDLSKAGGAMSTAIETGGKFWQMGQDSMKWTIQGLSDYINGNKGKLSAIGQALANALSNGINASGNANLPQSGFEGTGAGWTTGVGGVPFGASVFGKGLTNPSVAEANRNVDNLASYYQSIIGGPGHGYYDTDFASSTGRPTNVVLPGGPSAKWTFVGMTKPDPTGGIGEIWRTPMGHEILFWHMGRGNNGNPNDNPRGREVYNPATGKWGPLVPGQQYRGGTTVGQTGWDNGVNHLCVVTDAAGRTDLMWLTGSQMKGLKASALPKAVAQYGSGITSAAAATGINPSIIASMITQESSGNARARTWNPFENAADIGLMQVGPAEARLGGGKYTYNPNQNIRAGAGYLAYLLRGPAKGDLRTAIAMYNGGPGRPNYAYADEVLSRASGYGAGGATGYGAGGATGLYGTTAGQNYDPRLDPLAPKPTNSGGGVRYVPYRQAPEQFNPVTGRGQTNPTYAIELYQAARGTAAGMETMYGLAGIAGNQALMARYTRAVIDEFHNWADAKIAQLNASIARKGGGVSESAYQQAVRGIQEQAQLKAEQALNVVRLAGAREAYQIAEHQYQIAKQTADQYAKIGGRNGANWGMLFAGAPNNRVAQQLIGNYLAALTREYVAMLHRDMASIRMQEARYVAAHGGNEDAAHRGFFQAERTAVQINDAMARANAINRAQQQFWTGREWAIEHLGTHYTDSSGRRQNILPLAFLREITKSPQFKDMTPAQIQKWLGYEHQLITGETIEANMKAQAQLASYVQEVRAGVFTTNKKQQDELIRSAQQQTKEMIKLNNQTATANWQRAQQRASATGATHIAGYGRVTPVRVIGHCADGSVPGTAARVGPTQSGGHVQKPTTHHAVTHRHHTTPGTGGGGGGRYYAEVAPGHPSMAQHVTDTRAEVQRHQALQVSSQMHTSMKRSEQHLSDINNKHDTMIALLQDIGKSVAKTTGVPVSTNPKYTTGIHPGPAHHG